MYNFSILRLKIPAASRVLIMTLWIYEHFFYIFNNSFTVSSKICDMSPDNNLSTKTKWRNVWLNVQYLVIWYLNENLHLSKSYLVNVSDKFFFYYSKIGSGMSTESEGKSTVVHFSQYRLTLIPARISNHMPRKVWDEITYRFPNRQRLPLWSLGMDVLFLPAL